MDNPETQATLGTHDQDKQNKNTTQFLLDTTIRNQTDITYIRRAFRKKLEVKTNRTLFLCVDRNGHQNTELKT
jgi:hypothetical protein